jgi:hypothetical protein
LLLWPITRPAPLLPRIVAAAQHRGDGERDEDQQQGAAGRSTDMMVSFIA